MWETIAAISALLSVVISIIALFIARSGTESSTRVAVEALETARRANDIALGRLREAPVVEYASISPRKGFEFINPAALDKELENIITVANRGQVPIDELALELIGIEPHTYPMDDACQEIRPLPSLIISVKLTSLLQPTAFAHIDIRLPILMYLEKLTEKLPDRTRIYRTIINAVLMPKAIGDTFPAAVSSQITINDRALLTVIFSPSIVETNWAENLKRRNYIEHRVYSPSGV